MSGFSAAWTKAVWIGGACVLGLEWVAFIGLASYAAWIRRIPVVIGAPVVWCGLEWVRKNLVFGGLAYAALEHTQYRMTTLIQIADIFGEYAVGMLVVFVGACAGRVFAAGVGLGYASCAARRPGASMVAAVVGCVFVLATVATYGSYRVGEAARFDGRSGGGTVTIAVLQGNIDNTIEQAPGQPQLRFARYKALSEAAGSIADLVVWPEDSVTLPLYDIGADFVPASWEAQPRAKVDEMLEKTKRTAERPIIELAKASTVPLLLGIATWRFENGRAPEVRNSAVFVHPENGVGPIYDKVKLAPFLEYSPLTARSSRDRPAFSTYSAGRDAVAFQLSRKHRQAADLRNGPRGAISRAALTAAVNICFDSSFPHVIRQQVCRLREAGHAADLIINISNDGSCSYSSLNDMHLATHVFRAVENRTPYLCATNGGHAAWISETGRILAEGRSGTATFVLAHARPHNAETIYQRIGDIIPMSCACFDVFLAICWASITLRSALRRAPRSAARSAQRRGARA